MEYGECPDLFVAADKTSHAGQRKYAWLIRFDLALLILGALLPASFSWLAPQYSKVANGTLALLLIAAWGSRIASKALNYDRAWFDGRAVAESIKSLAWRYMMRVEPFDVAQEEAGEVPRQRIRAVMDERRNFVSDTSMLVGAARLEKLKMIEVRGWSLPERRDFYARHRLDNQRSWYSGNMALKRRSSTILFFIGIVAQMVAIGFAVAAVRSSAPTLVSAIGIAAAAASAATAWGQLGRYDELTRSYGLAAQELIEIAARLSRVASEQSLAKVVIEGESAISREHTLWAAKRG